MADIYLTKKKKIIFWTFTTIIRGGYFPGKLKTIKRYNSLANSLLRFFSQAEHFLKI